MDNQSGKPKLLDQLRDRIRLKHYSRRTEDAYLDWTKRFYCTTTNGTRKGWASRRLRHF